MYNHDVLLIHKLVIKIVHILGGKIGIIAYLFILQSLHKETVKLRSFGKYSYSFNYYSLILGPNDVDILSSIFSMISFVVLCVLFSSVYN